jgi:hypothetical protein
MAAIIAESALLAQRWIYLCSYKVAFSEAK